MVNIQFKEGELQMNIKKLNREDTLLLIIDIQERLAAQMANRDRVVANTVRLINVSNILDFPLLITEQYPKGLGSTEPEIKDALAGKYQPHEKLSFSCCGTDGFVDILKQTGVQSIMLVGMETHVCVLQTALDLLANGYEVFVIVDAVCSRSELDYEIGTQRMRDAGAIIATTEMVIFELMKVAGTVEFKAILPFVK